MIEGENYTIT